MKPPTPPPATPTPSAPLRVALVADSAPQMLARELEKALAQRAIHGTVRTWAFASPLTVRTELDAFQPHLVLLWFCSEAGELPDVAPLLSLPYPLLCYTAVSCDDGTCGSLALTRPDALRSRILRWNNALIRLAQENPKLALVDLDLLQSRLGRNTTFDPRLWEVARLAIAPTALPEMARLTADAIASRLGRQRKVLVTDLDNTLWEGEVAEVGAEGVDFDAPGRSAYRAWLFELARRGILLAVASRNDAGDVASALKRLDPLFPTANFSAVETGWGAKSTLLRAIANRLHVSTDSLVFIDDRPEQRAEVRQALPEVLVPELPSDPACWCEALASANLFETPQITEDDLHRAQTLREDAERQRVAEVASPEDYIRSLEQELTPEPLGPSNLARAAQLTQRCNQFNMRGTRHTLDSLAGKRGWLYRLRDRFGDMGVISAVILEGDFIETWVISCRALNRGVESLILDHLRTQGNFTGAYRATPRNGRCKNLYAELNFPHRPEETP